MDVQDIEAHYVANRRKYLKTFTFRAGTPEAAEDIVQEAYERVLRYRHSCSPREADKWIRTVLNNCLRDFKNQEKGHVAEEFEEESAEGTTCPHYEEHVMKEVYELIDTKGPIHQEILHLFFRYEYNAADISRITDHSYSNCHKIIHRFRQELRELYG